MSIDQQQKHQATSRVRACWQAAGHGYRVANAATHHAVGFVVKLMAILYFLACALFLGLRFLVLPNIAEYKPEVERMATRALGNEVTIAAIDASWNGLRPHLTLTDVAIRGNDGRPALTLPRVAATVSWWSVTAGALRLHTLEIDRPEMQVLRDRSGRLHVAGMLIDLQKRGSGKGADWVLSQREIVIRQGRVRWQDENVSATALTLDNVQFVLRNHWRSHEFALQATPPAELGAPLDMRGAFQHPHFASKISDPRLWKGELFVDLQNADLAGWKRHVDVPVEIRAGRGSVRAWLDLDHAKVANFTADLKLSEVSTRLRSDLDLLNLEQVSGRISVREEFNPELKDGVPTFGKNGHAIALTDFSLRTGDGLSLPATTISESFTPARNGKPARTEVTAKALDLRTLADFAERLPLPEEHRQKLDELAPRGTLKDFSVQWQGAYPDVSAYRVRGEFAGLSINARQARAAVPKTATQPAQAAAAPIPGFGNLSGRVDATERGGSLNVASREVVLELPDLLSEPALPLDSLSMQTNWTFQPRNQLLIELKKLEFAQGGMTGSLSGKHQLPLDRKPGASPGTIDLSGRLDGFRLETIGRYLPARTPDRLREWLTGALVAGTARDVDIRLRGDLAHFPFSPGGQKEKARGEFRVAGKIENGTLNYTPGRLSEAGNAPLWPLLEAINGKFAFNRTSMEIRADSAKTHGVDLSNVTAAIADLQSPDRLLAVQGEALGTLQAFVRYVNDSPAAKWTAGFTRETKAGGNAQLGLKLRLPLARMEESKVEGTLQFLNNGVTLQNAIPPLSGINGKLQFSETGFSLASVRAGFLGGSLTVSGGKQKGEALLIKADGSLSADGVRQAYPSPAAERLAGRITGSTRYSASIQAKDKALDVLVESGMQGIALDFPPPLRKGADESMPLKFQLAALPPHTGADARDEIRLSLGSTVAVHYEREKDEARKVPWRVVRGGIGINVPAPHSDRGVVAHLDLKSLNVDAWRDVIASVTDGGRQKRGGAGQAEDGGPGSDIAQYIEPESIAAQATELIIAKRRLDNVVVGLSQRDNAWQASIDSTQASGHVTWNKAAAGRDMGKVTARLASLIIPKSSVSDVTELLEGKESATRMPALDIVAENFELLDKKFGRLELVANNVRTPAGNEWQINKLLIANPDGELKASGKWTIANGSNLSGVAYTFNIANAGRLLDRFGFPNVLRGGTGKMEGEISWNGLPFALDVPSLAGKIQLDMEAGQFLKVDPSAAKLLGVLSLQSLPRRLVLDFRDVFSEGFAFDGVTATASIAQGVAKTDNFKMRSVAATVLIDGAADIARESQNLHVVVLPEINVGAASVVYGLAVNPVIGVGTFLAQLFLREPLMRAFTFEYQVTGPWKDPVVTKLARRPPDAPPDSAGQAEKSG